MLETISPWWGYGAALFGFLLFGAVRMPFLKRSRRTAVRERRSPGADGLGLALVAVGMHGTPVVAALGLLRFADQPFPVWRLAAGAVLLAAATVLFYRSHADLGTNWAATLTVRAQHHLVTSGVYARIRHPMYSALMLMTLAQAAFVPNWVAALAAPLSFGLFLPIRMAQEERMMRDTFGDAYGNYARRTNRLVPSLRAHA
jgi:protein-S-isoprenylcysteine O-methyltransferase Ste14